MQEKKTLTTYPFFTFVAKQTLNMKIWVKLYKPTCHLTLTPFKWVPTH